jgi:ABC-type lipoprotein release transport system permease subunit
MSGRTLWQDERAIEGLPIRLVIALVVGVACLGVMLSVVGGFSSLNETELDTNPEPDIVEEGNHTVNVTVVDTDGEPIEAATVIARGETAQLDSLARGETNENGTTRLAIEPRLRPNQDEGRIELDIQPPHGEYVDNQENTGILVIND